jgi:Urocanase Rossmann-like domain
MPNDFDLQLETMRVYRTLVELREDWGGKLVLCCGPGCATGGITTAVSIAGGTTLAIDAAAAAMKTALRSGYLDFVVNTLDEALRTLKNEIRQKRPLSVGLIAGVDATLTEAVERGLQPDLQFSWEGSADLSHPQLEALRDRGMQWRSVSGPVSGSDGDECFFAAADGVALREIDAKLLAALAADDMVRRRWLERVPKYLREARSGGRWIWLAEGEVGLMAADLVR